VPLKDGCCEKHRKMGLIKEPEGVDFIIQSPPLTDQERKEISEFIRSGKMENNKAIKRSNSKKTSKKIDA
jgi:hypothetical protein